jgi:hypothetical protein
VPVRVEPERSKRDAHMQPDEGPRTAEHRLTAVDGDREELVAVHLHPAGFAYLIDRAHPINDLTHFYGGWGKR